MEPFSIYRSRLTRTVELPFNDHFFNKVLPPIERVTISELVPGERYIYKFDNSVVCFRLKEVGTDFSKIQDLVKVLGNVDKSKIFENYTCYLKVDTRCPVYLVTSVSPLLIVERSIFLIKKDENLMFVKNHPVMYTSSMQAVASDYDG